MHGLVMDHIHIITDDPYGTARWFADMLGGEVIKLQQPDGRERIDIRFGEALIYISPAPSTAEPAADEGRRRRGVDHIGFSVPDVDSAVAVLQQKGVRVLEEPATPRPGIRTAFVSGPEGIRIELFHRS
jgi:catechol 2,3-dioxygenase-like lactoylglutathione lyase family enzyme